MDRTFDFRDFVEVIMIRKSVRIATCTLAAALAFSGMGMTAQAASVSSFLPSGGVDLTLADGNKLENIALNNTSKQIESIVELTIEEAQIAAAATVQEPTEEDLFRNLVIAQVNSYVNVRSMPSEEGEVLGKLYNNSVGTFLGEENGWYQISSGSVTGYVKGEYCVTGDAAIELAKEVGTRFATVTTTTLFVRQEPTTESSILGMVPIEEELVVLEEAEGWVKVDIEEGNGWVSTDYVTLHSEFVQAESKEEEAARLAKEEEERRRAREAAAAAAAASQKQETIENATATVASTDGNEMGKAVAEYALQFVGNPYVYGGSSLTNGTDCSGFVMSVYANFGVSLPHSSAADRKQGYAVDGLANAQPGDLICYSGHVALYIGDGQIVHASTSKTGIIVSNADYKKILAVRRIF
uniref:C40 family peptidase n=1 Tax=Acetatifactor sp. TaxID=1872090 RepID=UPI0040569AD6